MTPAPDRRLRLLLVRHAKTEQGSPDHERALLPRGWADARAAGEWLAEAGPVPDLVICSTATRAAQTWEGMAEHPGLSGVEVWPDRRVYNAWPESLLEALSEVPEDRDTVAVVGHAPSVPDLVDLLLDGTDEDHDAEALRRLEEGYPTMTTAVVELPGDWAGVAPGTGVLRALHIGRGG